jgi:hypothetical protein
MVPTKYTPARLSARARARARIFSKSRDGPRRNSFPAAGHSPELWHGCGITASDPRRERNSGGRPGAFPKKEKPVFLFSGTRPGARRNSFRGAGRSP